MIKPIKKVSLIGLGALGIMYSEHMLHQMPFEDLRIIADTTRIKKYTEGGIYCNDVRCDFNYVTPEEEVESADLLIFAVKYTQLQEAITAVEKHVGEHTIILSVLNGVVSESDIGAVYGEGHNVYCVAQGMTAVKEGNHLTYQNKGILCFGELNTLKSTDNVERVMKFFDRLKMPYEINNQMQTKLWSKLLANVGINQTVAYYKTTNIKIQEPGVVRDQMIAAMKEVIQVAELEAVDLSAKDIEYWLGIISTLEPGGMPSMAQDVKANRPTEVELFAGTILTLAKKHGIDVPVNEMFYKHFAIK